jgi:hypothetical protein
MKVQDAVYYVGLMTGMIVGVLSSRALGYPSLYGVIAGVVIGVGVGYVAERAWSRFKR